MQMTKIFSAIKNIIPVHNEDKHLVNILNLLIFLIPLSFIAGNLLINLNILIFIIIGIFNYKLTIFKISKNFTIAIAFFFFILVIYSTFYNFISNGNLTNLVKSINFIRFLLFILIIRKMINNDDIRIKEFFILSLILSVFVSSDVIFQEIFGFNFFGMKPQYLHRLSGIFGDELIAGAYLSRFGLIGILFLISFRKDISKLNFKFISLFSIILIGIILTTNRMPLINFLAVIFCSTILIKENRIFFIKLFSLSLIIFGIFYAKHERTNDFYHDFFEKGFKITHSIVIDAVGAIGILDKQKQKRIKKNVEVENNFKGQGWHINIFYTALKTWEMNPAIGGGIKSFRVNCWKIDPTEENIKNLKCGNHPHNYFLEVLTDTGILGIILFSILVLSIIYKFYFSKLMHSYYSRSKYINSFFLFIMMIEFFPFKSTGSFFTTGTATFFFLIIAFLISENRIKAEK